VQSGVDTILIPTSLIFFCQPSNDLSGTVCRYDSTVIRMIIGVRKECDQPAALNMSLPEPLHIRVKDNIVVHQEKIFILQQD
jgi:hypothetical protein